VAVKHPGPADPELAALLQHRKIERQVPPDLRARVLARARAALAGDAIPPAQPWAPAPAPLARGRRVLLIALAASIAVAVGAVGAVAALRGFGARPAAVASPARPAPASDRTRNASRCSASCPFGNRRAWSAISARAAEKSRRVYAA